MSSAVDVFPLAGLSRCHRLEILFRVDFFEAAAAISVSCVSMLFRPTVGVVGPDRGERGRAVEEFIDIRLPTLLLAADDFNLGDPAGPLSPSRRYAM